MSIFGTLNLDGDDDATRLARTPRPMRAPAPGGRRAAVGQRAERATAKLAPPQHPLGYPVPRGRRTGRGLRTASLLAAGSLEGEDEDENDFDSGARAVHDWYHAGIVPGERAQGDASDEAAARVAGRHLSSPAQLSATGMADPFDAGARAVHEWYKTPAAAFKEDAPDTFDDIDDPFDVGDFIDG